VGSGGFETFLRPEEAERLRRANRQEAGLAKKAACNEVTGCYRMEGKSCTPHFNKIPISVILSKSKRRQPTP